MSFHLYYEGDTSVQEIQDYISKDPNRDDYKTIARTVFDRFPAEGTLAISDNGSRGLNQTHYQINPCGMILCRYYDRNWNAKPVSIIGLFDQVPSSIQSLGWTEAIRKRQVNEIIHRLNQKTKSVSYAEYWELYQEWKEYHPHEEYDRGVGMKLFLMRVAEKWGMNYQDTYSAIDDLCDGLLTNPLPIYSDVAPLFETGIVTICRSGGIPILLVRDNWSYDEITYLVEAFRSVTRHNCSAVMLENGCSSAKQAFLKRLANKAELLCLTDEASSPNDTMNAFLEYRYQQALKQDLAEKDSKEPEPIRMGPPLIIYL